MATFQTLLAEEGTGPLMLSEEFYLKLGARTGADDLPTLSAKFPNKSPASHNNGPGPSSGEMSTPSSEIAVKVENVETEGGASRSALDRMERTP